jgi:hypothetical protein
MGFSVASLLMKLRPGEKRQRGRWRPGWRNQKGPGRGFLFRLAKMGQDPVDNVLVLNTSDDSDRSAAALAPVQRLWTEVVRVINDSDKGNKP